MAKYSEEARLEHREIVRSILVANPHASCRQIAEITEFDKDYVASHIKKIKREKTSRFNSKKLVEELSSLEDTYTNLIHKAFEVLESTSQPRTKIEAIRTIASISLMLFKMKLDLGVLDRNLSDERVMTFADKKEFIQMSYDVVKENQRRELEAEKADKMADSNISAG